MRNFRDTFETCRYLSDHQCIFNLHDCTFMLASQLPCFLFFLSSNSTLKKKYQDSGFDFYMVYTVVLNASYKIKSCLLLNDFMFSCCFHVCLNNFFCATGGIRGGFQISNVESTLAWHNEFGQLPQLNPNFKNIL